MIGLDYLKREMTELDYLKQEMMKRGCTKPQVESKLVPVVLDIVANSGTLYTDIGKAQEELDSLHSKIARRKDNLDAQERRLAERELSLRQEIKEVNEYIGNFLNDIQKCETDDARDRMKIAQVFINSVNVDTKYDNTAFIVGLASIMTGMKLDAVDELKKINKKVPELTFGRR